jgi:hypothetical protein
MTPVESLQIQSRRHDSIGFSGWTSAAPHGFSAELSPQIRPLFGLMCLPHRFEDNKAALMGKLYEADFSLGLADLLAAYLSGATTDEAVKVLVVVK